LRLPAEQRRTQLLEVAIEIFAERGFHATSMDDIAEAAGVTKPVLYQHFPSKRALYRELLDDVDRQLTERLVVATAAATSGRERVQEGFAAYFRFVAAHRASFRLLFGASVRNDPEFAAVAEATIDRVAELIAQLIDIDAVTDHRHTLAHAMVGMAEATSRRVVNDEGENDPDRLAAWLAEMAWFGLRGVRAGELARD
jgi:AcrR family transcriptional regulator